MIKKKYYLLVFITMLLCFSVSAQMPLLIYEKSAKDTIELLEAIDNLKEIKNQKEFKYLELNRKMEKHVYDSILIVNDSIRNIRNDYYDKRVSALHELVREHFYYEELKNYQEILLPSLWYEYVNGSYKKQATQLLALL